MAQSYENLKIWKESVDLAESVYSLTKKFPKDEIFGMTSQLRRAAVSVSANIAEGSGRHSRKDFCRFIDIAIGSLNETESLLHVAHKLKYIIDLNFNEIISSIKKLGVGLGGFRKYLNT
jgi:four helix bundle protein